MAERIGRQGPWFYLRNLTLMLGRIGNESHLPVPEPLLSHNEPRVQGEAVFAIQNIGRGSAAGILWRHLPLVDDDNKGFIISAIGKSRYAQALPEMIEMLESRALGKTKKAKNEIMVNLCEAMELIGAPEAVPVLEKIAQSKGFLPIKGYDSPVKALARIRGGS